jgi:HEAT repeat protein
MMLTAAAMGLLWLAGTPAAFGDNVQDLTGKLSSDDVETREQAAEALGEMGADAAPAAERIAEHLSDPYWDVRKAAARALAKIGPKAVPAIRKALRSDDYWAPLYAAEAAGRMGPDAAAAVPDLVAAMEDADTERMVWIGWALSKMGSRAAPAVPALMREFKRADTFAAAYLAEAIAAVGPEATQAAPVLLSRVGEVDEAGKALGDLGPDAVDLVLKKWKNSNNKKKTWALMEAVATMGPSAKAAVPLYEKQLTDGIDQWFTALAARCLGKLGPTAEDATDELVGVLKNHNYADARKAAAGALGKIGKKDPKIIAALEKATEDKNNGVAREAKRALDALNKTDE